MGADLEVKSPFATIAAVIAAHRAVGHERTTGIQRPSPRDLIRALQECAKPNAPSLSDVDLAGDFFTGVLQHFTKAEFSEAFEATVAGVRKDLANATLERLTHLGFRRIFQELMEDAMCVLVELPKSQRRSMSNQLEQLATETERKASALTDELDYDNEQNEFLARLLAYAQSYRSYAAQLDSGVPREKNNKFGKMNRPE
jgi:hypothetical protein